MTIERSARLSRDLELLRYFRDQLRTLSDEKTLEIFRTFGTSKFSNREVRPILGTTPQAAWFRLSRLVRLGFLEKRGNSYRVSETTETLVAALGSAFRGMLTHKTLAENRNAGEEVLELARQGVELMYAKGMIQATDVARHQKTLAELEKEFRAHDA